MVQTNDFVDFVDFVAFVEVILLLAGKDKVRLPSRLNYYYNIIFHIINLSFQSIKEISA